MIEKFGINQTPISEEQWLEVGQKMKSSPYVRAKQQRNLAEAYHQSKRFQNLSYLAGPVLFLAFLKFPMVRVQPGFQRVAISGAMAYPLYSYINGLANKLKIKRIKNIYRKTVTEHMGHERVIM